MSDPLERSPERPVKLLDQVRKKLRLRHFAIRTEEAYVDWIRRYILFHVLQRGASGVVSPLERL
jgi:hypothetical protein